MHPEEPDTTRHSFEVVVGDDFVSGPSHEAGEDPDVDARFQEVDRPVRKYGVGPIGVEAIDRLFIGTVDGTRPRLYGAVGSRAQALDQVRWGPSGAQGNPCNRPARPPGLGPAGIFGDQDRARGAVLYVRDPRHVVLHHHALVIRYPVNQTAVYQ